MHRRSDRCLVDVDPSVYAIWAPICHKLNNKWWPEQQAGHFADDIFTCISLNESCSFWLKFHWYLYLGVPIILSMSQNRIRKRIDVERPLSHYLNQCWPSLLPHIYIGCARWVKHNLRVVISEYICHLYRYYLLDVLPEVQRAQLSSTVNAVLYSTEDHRWHYTTVYYGSAIMGTISNHQPHPFIRVQIKENIKAPRHWPLWGEFTGDRWIPRTKGQ